MDTGFCSFDGWSSPLGRDFCLDTSDFDVAASFDDGDSAGGTACSFGRAFGGTIFGAGSKKAAADEATGTAAGALVRAAFFFAGWSSCAGSTAVITAFRTSSADGAEAPSFGGVFGASTSGGVFGPSTFGGVLGPSITAGGFGASPFGGAATICCGHSLATSQHLVAEASPFLEKLPLQRARQLRRPEIWIQIFERLLLHRLSQAAGPQLLPRCRAQISSCRL